MLNLCDVQIYLTSWYKYMVMGTSPASPYYFLSQQHRTLSSTKLKPASTVHLILHLDCPIRHSTCRGRFLSTECYGNSSKHLHRTSPAAQSPPFILKPTKLRSQQRRHRNTTTRAILMYAPPRKQRPWLSGARSSIAQRSLPGN